MITEIIKTIMTDHVRSSFWVSFSFVWPRWHPEIDFCLICLCFGSKHLFSLSDGEASISVPYASFLFCVLDVSSQPHAVRRSQLKYIRARVKSVARSWWLYYLLALFSLSPIFLIQIKIRHGIADARGLDRKGGYLPNVIFWQAPFLFT